MSEYRAAIVDDFATMTVRLHVGHWIGDQAHFLMEDGAWRTIDRGQASPPGAGLVLPEGAVAAIADAFHPRAGHKVEVDRLSEALAVERQRVDRVLDRLLKRDEGETTAA